MTIEFDFTDMGNGMVKARPRFDGELFSGEWIEGVPNSFVDDVATYLEGYSLSRRDFWIWWHEPELRAEIEKWRAEQEEATTDDAPEEAAQT
jgi:hypothetical protein